MSARALLAAAAVALLAAPAGAGSWDPILRRTAPPPRESGAGARVRALELEAQIRRAAERAERAERERAVEERRAAEPAQVDAQRRADERRATVRRLDRELETAEVERRAEGDTEAAQRLRAFELERDLEAARDGVERELRDARTRAELERRRREP